MVYRIGWFLVAFLFEEIGKFDLSLEYGDLPVRRKGMAGTVRHFSSGLSTGPSARVVMM